MTLMGKIFTLLIAIASFMWLVLAVMVFSTHTNWKRAALENKQVADERNNAAAAQVREMERLRAMLEQERVARQYALAERQAKIDQLEGDLRTAKATHDAYVASNQNVAEQLTLANSRNSVLEAQVEQLKQELHSAEEERDAQFAKAIALSDTIDELGGDLTEVKTERMVLALKNTKMKAVLDSRGLTEDTPTEDRQPVVDGYVTAVSTKEEYKDLVEISLGADDGLREGHQLDVFRGATYIGRVIVRRTSPNRAVGKVMPGTLVRPIQKGDRVTTRLG